MSCIAPHSKSNVVLLLFARAIYFIAIEEQWRWNKRYSAIPPPLPAWSDSCDGKQENPVYRLDPSVLLQQSERAWWYLTFSTCFEPEFTGLIFDLLLNERDRLIILYNLIFYDVRESLSLSASPFHLWKQASLHVKCPYKSHRLPACLGVGSLTSDPWPFLKLGRKNNKPIKITTLTNKDLNLYINVWLCHEIIALITCSMVWLPFAIHKMTLVLKLIITFTQFLNHQIGGGRNGWLVNIQYWHQFEAVCSLSANEKGTWQETEYLQPKSMLLAI